MDSVQALTAWKTNKETEAGVKSVFAGGKLEKLRSTYCTVVHCIVDGRVKLFIFHLVM